MGLGAEAGEGGEIPARTANHPLVLAALIAEPAVVVTADTRVIYSNKQDSQSEKKM